MANQQHPESQARQELTPREPVERQTLPRQAIALPMIQQGKQQ